MENHLGGLPEHGVLLTGSLENPVIENRSGKTVIAYVFKTADQNGYGQFSAQLLATSMQPAGIPDGGGIYVRGNRVKPSGEGPIVRAALLNVIFADGQIVGLVDEGPATALLFESFGKRIKVITEVGLLGKAGAWDQVEALAKDLTKLSLRSPSGENSILYFERRVAAARLAQERREKGDAAAAHLAELYSSLPTLWR